MDHSSRDWAGVRDEAVICVGRLSQPRPSSPRETPSTFHQHTLRHRLSAPILACQDRVPFRLLIWHYSPLLDTAHQPGNMSTKPKVGGSNPLRRTLESPVIGGALLARSAVRPYRREPAQAGATSLQPPRLSGLWLLWNQPTHEFDRSRQPLLERVGVVPHRLRHNDIFRHDPTRHGLKRESP
jgi:hypothetical protein